MSAIISDLRPFILALAGALTQYFDDEYTPKLDPAEAQKIWADAFQMDWNGDFNLLPKTTLTTRTISCIHSRLTYQRFINYFEFNQISLPKSIFYNEYFQHANQVPNNITRRIVVSAIDAAPMEHCWDECHDLLPSPVALASAAIVGGHLKLLKILRDDYGVNPARLCYIPNHGYAMGIAAFNGDVNMIQYLHANGSQACTIEAMNLAAREGHLDVVMWLFENRTEGCITSALRNAKEKNHTKIVTYLTHRQDMKWDLDIAALHGNLDVVRKLHELGGSCTSAAMDNAAANGHFEIVKYLHVHRSEGCTTNAMDLAAARGHVRVVKYLNENRMEGCTKNAIEYAAANNYFEVVRYLDENCQIGLDQTRCLNFATSPDMLLYLVDNIYDDL
ncbi:hypothetical protein THRCLA_08446 [Thraustotheca clavata]|uniref:Uncharacterized protein n=1 Tax=Thraustotheca clavata TaxID=74557 RepID=A0A1V9Z635_9STRA|nr:hypothetical protein THRCLA_08446 [Thraustotheca clavata]